MATADEPFDGEAFFRTLVHHFYESVAADPILRPMYPSDLAPAEERLALFLLQYFGGDRRYEELRGEPKLRMRHLRFKIDQAARDTWVARMTAALDATVADGYQVGPEDLAVISQYFEQTATLLMNQGLSIAGS
jgi:hemoglobin